MSPGLLVAAAVVRAGPRVLTLVHPSVRAHGIEEQLLDWAHGQAPDATVETESLTDARSRLFAARGLTQVFAEDVMRISLAEPVPAPVWPDGITLTNWSPDVAERFHAVWEAAFRERPGFPGTPAEEWIGNVGEEEAFRAAWSVLATHDRLGDVGFVVGTVGWIDQVGVAPAARGQGLGAALVRESLSRMRTDGASEAWLNVNVDNPARLLYERLGFRIEGRRARFRPGSSAAGSPAAGSGSPAAGSPAAGSESPGAGLGVSGRRVSGRGVRASGRRVRVSGRRVWLTGARSYAGTSV